MGLRQLRAARQMLLGLTPLVVIAATVLVLMALRLAEANGPLRAATQTATAVVTATGLGEGGRQIAVEYADASGTTQTGRLTLVQAQDLPLDQQIAIAYDPDRPAVVYAPGDALTSAVSDLVNGILVVAVILVGVLAVTLVRLLRRRGLAARERRQVQVRRAKYRRGLSDRTWFVVDTERGPAWVPVYWDPAVERIREEPVAVAAYGSVLADSLVSFDVYGATVWPSGRRRLVPPKGVQRELGPPAGEVSLRRQVRADSGVVFLAPLLGLLWAYIDGSGAAGFFIATAMAVGLLFWLPAVYGSDPT